MLQSVRAEISAMETRFKLFLSAPFVSSRAEISARAENGTQDWNRTSPFEVHFWGCAFRGTCCIIGIFSLQMAKIDRTKLRAYILPTVKMHALCEIQPNIININTRDEYSGQMTVSRLQESEISLLTKNDDTFGGAPKQRGPFSKTWFSLAT